jgi:predicted RNA-binding protein with PIN domain
LEAAFRVARLGEKADPVEPAPPTLRPYLGFSRLPDTALEPVRRAVDDDDDFRARVLEAASEDELGEAPWLWLARPDGWEERLAELEEAVRREQETEQEAREERSARRRVVQLEAALRRAEARAAEQTARAQQAREEMTAERNRRREVERASAAVRDELARARVERDGALADRDDLRAALARAEADLAARPAEVSSPQGGSDRAAPVETAPAVIVDTDALARALGEATAALGNAAEAVAAAVSAVSVSAPEEPTSAEDADVTARPGREQAPAPARRHPARLPGGVFDDSLQAAEHLLRIPSVLLLVDGYNVSNAVWPGLPLPDQRTRLTDALGELQARTGAAVQIVFDGAVGQGPWVAGGRPAVQVRFSPPDVEADDVLVEIIEGEPPGRTVVLATSDRELRDRARRLGANLLGARQLSAAMRR